MCKSSGFSGQINKDLKMRVNSVNYFEMDSLPEWWQGL